MSKIEHARAWGLLWRSENSLDGIRRHIIYEEGLPILFRTRREARKHNAVRYGYIKQRLDLRAEPHGWRVPQVVRLIIGVEGP